MNWVGRVFIAAVLCGLAVIAYLPAQRLPLIADDYPVILLARRYGAVSGWSELIADPLYRCRAISNVLTYWLDATFGFHHGVFNVAALALHVLNTFLVALLGSWKRIGWSVSIPAAAFFAVAEGHQEAVIWFSAMPDLNVTTFVLISLLSWIRYLEHGCRTAWTVSLVGFILALFSKESAVALVGLQLLILFVERSRRWLALVPFAVISLLYFYAAYAARSTHLHFNDGTFSLHAPFLLTILNSTARMYWFWGLLAGIALIWWRRSEGVKFLSVALLAGAIALFPYSFLMYMDRVPSRHTYLASVALAMVVGAAWNVMQRQDWRPQLIAGLTLAALVHNVGYIWIRKHEQFLERAAPTTELVRLARSTDGPIIVECFPYAKDVAVGAMILDAHADPNRLIFNEPPGGCPETHRYRLPREKPQLLD